MDEKFVNYDDQQMAELRTIVTNCIAFIKEQTRPALDILTAETADKLTNQFLLESKAAFLADEQAIAEGYTSLADKYFQLEKKRKEDEAAEKAKNDAIEKAKKDEEDRLFAEEVKIQKALQDQRDKEDAERMATLKATLKAQAMGESQAQVASV